MHLDLSALGAAEQLSRLFQHVLVTSRKQRMTSVVSHRPTQKCSRVRKGARALFQAARSTRLTKSPGSDIITFAMDRTLIGGRRV